MKKLAIAFLFVLPAWPLFAESSTLQQQLEGMIRDFDGHVGLFAKDLKTGRTVAINADEPTQTASVIKLALMLETFAEVKQGKIKLEDALPLEKSNQVQGSGILQFLHPGLNTNVEDCVVLMIDLSDNTATNQLIDKVPLANVNARLAAMGLKNTYFYKKVFRPADGPQPPDQKNFGLGKTTAREMAELMESIERCDLGTPDLCHSHDRHSEAPDGAGNDSAIHPERRHQC
jgi:beta-lactamase class A